MDKGGPGSALDGAAVGWQGPPSSWQEDSASHPLLPQASRVQLSSSCSPPPSPSCSYHQIDLPHRHSDPVSTSRTANCSSHTALPRLPACSPYSSQSSSLIQSKSSPCWFLNAGAALPIILLLLKIASCHLHLLISNLSSGLSANSVLMMPPQTGPTISQLSAF